MKKLLAVIFLSLLLSSPGDPSPSAVKAVSVQQEIPGTSAGAADAYNENEDDIFSTNYERELLSRRIFKKSLPPLSRAETIRWTFRTANANTLL
jgi:hypothetical protein